MLSQEYTDVYANKIKLITGKSCQLRSIYTSEQHQFERIIFLYSNIEHITLYRINEIFLKSFPQFIENGLKYLVVRDSIDSHILEKVCNIGRNLRSLRFTVLLHTDDDIASLNRLQLPINVKLEISCYKYSLPLLSKSICETVSKCNIIGSHRSHDYRTIAKLENLEDLTFRQFVSLLFYYLAVPFTNLVL